MCVKHYSRHCTLFPEESPDIYLFKQQSFGMRSTHYRLGLLRGDVNDAEKFFKIRSSSTALARGEGNLFCLFAKQLLSVIYDQWIYEECIFSPAISKLS